jgi:PAS domain S-box-containing protein
VPTSLHKVIGRLSGGPQPRRRWLTVILWTSGTVLVVMSVFEFLIDWLIPDHLRVQSHIVTILFAAVLTGVITHMALRVYHALLQETTDEIAERLRVSDELVQERNFMWALMDHTPDQIYFKDARGRYLRVNKAMADACGLATPSAAMGKSADDLFGPLYAKTCKDDEALILESGQPLVGREEQESWADGRTLWVSSTKLPLRDAAGRVIGTFGLSRDITAQKSTEERLRQLSAAVEQSPSLVLITDRAGDITYVNPRFCEVTGYAAEELIGRKPGMLRSKDVSDEDRQRLWAIITAGAAWHGEFHNAKKSGETFWGAASVSPLRNAGGEITHFIEVMEDVTDKKRHEAARAALTEGLRAVLGLTDELIACPDEETLFRRAVELSRERLGLERCSLWIDVGDVVQGTFGTNLALQTTDERAWRLPKDAVWQERLRLRGPNEARNMIVEEPYSEWDGARMNEVGRGWIAVTPIQSSGHGVIGALCNDAAVTRAPPDPAKQEVVVVFCSLLGNIVARKRAERQRVEAEHRQREFMERADRLNSLGMLAAGMAHEINNPLQGMLSHVHAIKRSVPREFPARVSVEMVERGIETIANLVRRLLSFGVSEQTGDPAVAGETIDFTAKLLESQFKRARIKMAIDHRQGDTKLAMPRRELTQVLLNLMINARDAMPAGGRLDIVSDADDACGIIRIVDTGGGIPQEIRGKIFTPFFTTKGTKGTGLGLSVADSLVRGNGGSIEMESKVGEGTVFTLRIPRAGRRPT